MNPKKELLWSLRVYSCVKFLKHIGKTADASPRNFFLNRGQLPRELTSLDATKAESKLWN